MGKKDQCQRELLCCHCLLEAQGHRSQNATMLSTDLPLQTAQRCLPQAQDGLGWNGS